VATGAVNAKVISELVVGADGVTLSEPECDCGDVAPLVDPVAGVELELELEPPEPEAPELEPEPEPEPPQPASTTTASSTAAPAAGTRIRTRRASSTIAFRE
jgi:hypothetical protein